MLALLLVWLLAPTLPAAAQSAAAAQPSALSPSISHIFGESLTFELRGSASAPVSEVVLFYGQQGEGLVRRIYPPFTPGQSLDVVYTEELEGGQYPPGVELVAWWELYLANGDVQATDRLTYVYSDDLHDWALLQGERVDYYWYGGDAARAQELLQTTESVIERLSAEVGVTVDRRVSVYAYNSDRDMARALSSRSQSYDDRVLTLGVAVGHDTLLLLASHPDAEEIAAHELSHVVVGMATENPYSDLPRWLDEGLAMYAEGDLPPDNREALDRAVATDTLLSVRSMSSYSGQASEVDLFYGEAYSIVSFLLDRYGRDRMQHLLGVFAEGARQEDALQQVYGLTLAELDDLWRGSLGLVPRPLPQPTAPAAPAAPTVAQPESAGAPLPSPSAAVAARVDPTVTAVPKEAARIDAASVAPAAPVATAAVARGEGEPARRGVCTVGALGVLPLLGAALVLARAQPRAGG